LVRAKARRRGKSLRRPHHRNPAALVDAVGNALLRAASSGRTVTYGALMKTFGLSRGRALTRIISAVDRRESASSAPGFAAMIVRKDTGYPGGGYFCDDALPVGLRRPQSRSNDPRLSAGERDYIGTKQKEIWAYYGKAGVSRRRRNRIPDFGLSRSSSPGV
jgi:hypothetical protein